MAREVSPAVLAAMKHALEQRIEEWLGFDIPDEDAEDYERWQRMVAEVSAIETLVDVVGYLESEGMDVDSFLANFKAIDAGN